MAYPVTSTISDSTVVLVVNFPDNDWIIEAVQAQLLALAQSFSWDENTYQTQDEIAETILNFLDDMTWEDG
jgi:hypothetical protein